MHPNYHHSVSMPRQRVPSFTSVKSQSHRNLGTTACQQVSRKQEHQIYALLHTDTHTNFTKTLWMIKIIISNNHPHLSYQQFSNFREHENPLEALLKHRLLVHPPPEPLIKQVWQGAGLGLVGALGPRLCLSNRCWCHWSGNPFEKHWHTMLFCRHDGSLTVTWFLSVQCVQFYSREDGKQLFFLLTGEKRGNGINVQHNDLGLL